MSDISQTWQKVTYISVNIYGKFLKDRRFIVNIF